MVLCYLVTLMLMILTTCLYPNWVRENNYLYAKITVKTLYSICFQQHCGTCNFQNSHFDIPNFDSDSQLLQTIHLLPGHTDFAPCSKTSRYLPIPTPHTLKFLTFDLCTIPCHLQLQETYIFQVRDVCFSNFIDPIFPTRMLEITK